MYQIGVAFKILQDGEHILVGYKNASSHLVFDNTMNSTREAWWVKSGHLTPDLEESKYAGVVYHESVFIEILLLLYIKLKYLLRILEISTRRLQRRKIIILSVDLSLDFIMWARDY